VAQPRFRIVLDTNTLLRGLVASTSAAAKVRRAAEARLFVPLLSKPVIDEYRIVLTDEEIVAKFPEITPKLVEITIRRLRFIGEYLRTPTARFEYRRDPADQKFVELAIDLQATHILSFDQDLLSLPRSGEAFSPAVTGRQVVDAPTFLDRHGAALGIG